jgi:signal transduction histidine kinase
MIFRPLDPQRAMELLRRYGSIVVLAGLVILGFAALADVGAADRQSAAARAARQEESASVAAARAILDRQQRVLDQLAAAGAHATDASAQQLLDRVGALAPGARGAALFDASGMLMLRSADELDETALAALGAEAASEAAARPGAAMLVTHAVGDAASSDTLVGLARPWSGSDGKLGGIALVVLDRSAFAGLDLLRGDGAALFPATPEADAAPIVAIGDFPLMLRTRAAPSAADLLHQAWPLLAIAAIGISALLGLVAVLILRLRAAERERARIEGLASDLREETAAAAAAADRSGELARAKSQFFAQVTHELRTPLNAILGFSETIRHEMFGPVANPRYLEYAGLIHGAGAHLLSLINDLLDNARIEAGKMEIMPIRVAAPALARSAFDLVELLAEGRDIAMITTGLTTCPDLNVDPRAMKQVLVNLLSNAIKYTRPGGRIDINFATRDDGGVAIEIADTGIGMSAEDLQLAFEPFGRASAIEARRQQGTGLGLSLARSLVRLHGGELSLTSRLDSGTTALIILPASAAFAGTVPSTAAKSETGSASARAA